MDKSKVARFLAHPVLLGKLRFGKKTSMHSSLWTEIFARPQCNFM